MPRRLTAAFLRRLALFFTSFALPAVPAAPAGETSQDRALLQRVADRVLAETTRRLVDRTSGETFAQSEALPLKPEISIESKFNAWYYQTWLVSDGMRRAAAVLTGDGYQRFAERNLEFLYQHLPYFERQQAAGFKAAPVGDGKLSPIGFYFAISEPWHTGLAPLVIEQSLRTGDRRYEPFLRRMEAYLAQAPRTPEGAIYRPNGRLMADDPYMLVPYLVRASAKPGGTAKLDAAVQQIIGAHRLLFEKEAGLYRHAWHVAQAKPLGLFWGRANGWMVLAQVELLASLPPAHPRGAELRRLIQDHAAGLARVQDPSGGWHQLLDRRESWIETSSTAMFVYGLARGVNEGWLDRRYTQVAIRGWAALAEKVTPDGDLTDICSSTDIGDVNYYLNRSRVTGDLHGFGPFLLAGSEIVRLQRSAKHHSPAR